ncbi:chitin elicitor receptor kinase 1-like [Trifolium pratense]|uniref:chitin elicitor receptor kinase 1-like n=1 Tax=Trifolium pratense TaxID=57577 RepID=UPI001E695DC7|nr:chitin elicitor receptor kinase 1-like [Trifolium pratense]
MITTYQIFLVFLIFLLSVMRTEGSCSSTCLGLASYYIPEGSNLTYINYLFNQQSSEIQKYSPNLKNIDVILTNTRINVPFTCECLNGVFLGHTFSYTIIHGDTYTSIANVIYSNLTTEDWVTRVNSYPPTDIPVNAKINVTVNCSCGVRQVSRKYGLFLTYPLRKGENLSGIAAENGVPVDVLQKYNPGSNFSDGHGLVFVPARDENGKFPPLHLRSGMSKGGIAGIVVGGAFVILLLAIILYIMLYRRRKVAEVTLLPVPGASEDQYSQLQHGCGSSIDKASESTTIASPRLTGITVDKSVEFSYEELAKATDGFSEAKIIGRGGFGSVYYAELRNEKAAIKKMDMQASKEFLAELKVLTHVHHLNLVRLIGYCVEGSLFLVYEYIENGNLSQHLRGTEKDPLSWPARVQIALDSARGLEYIHEHTVPVYIHRDVKSANILIDKNFRGKVADFGLTKLTEYGSSSLQTRLVGTFGYMPPEYAQYGEVSPKIDVYAFGVVLFELISGKHAIVKTNEPESESKGLVALFEEVLVLPDPKEDLGKFVDTRLGENYPIDSVFKMCQLAKACTHENAQLRPSMRSIVVALMTLSSAAEDWDVGSFYENQALVHLMSGR